MVYLMGCCIWNIGKYPYVSNESVAEFINRIGGIAPLRYASLDGHPFDLVAGVRVRSDSHKGNPIYSLRNVEDSRKLWLHKLKPKDVIQVDVFGILNLDDYSLWTGPYRDEWLIKIPKPSDP